MEFNDKMLIQALLFPGDEIVSFDLDDDIGEENLQELIDTIQIKYNYKKTHVENSLIIAAYLKRQKKKIILKNKYVDKIRYIIDFKSKYHITKYSYDIPAQIEQTIVYNKDEIKIENNFYFKIIRKKILKNHHSLSFFRKIFTKCFFFLCGAARRSPIF